MSNENLTVKDVMVLLGVSKPTVYALFRSGQLLKTKVRRRTLIRRRELERYLDRATKQPK